MIKKEYDILDEICERDLEIMRTKNEDYASRSDALSNFRTHGWLSFFVMIGIKIKRLEIISRASNVNFESREDTLRDIRNYCVLGLIWSETSGACLTREELIDLAQMSFGVLKERANRKYEYYMLDDDQEEMLLGELSMQLDNLALMNNGVKCHTKDSDIFGRNLLVEIGSLALMLDVSIKQRQETRDAVQEVMQQPSITEAVQEASRQYSYISPADLTSRNE